jgi:hypothetical protein
VTCGGQTIAVPAADELRHLIRLRTVADLAAFGTPARDIAMLIGCSSRQVSYLRKEAESYGLLPGARSGTSAG